MSNVENTTGRSSFFPAGGAISKGRPSIVNEEAALKRNSTERKEQLEAQSKTDVKLAIPDAVKDFGRIKKAVDLAPPIDNSKKISDLKEKIKNNTYEVDYDALAEKIINSEF